MRRSSVRLGTAPVWKYVAAWRLPLVASMLLVMLLVMLLIEGFLTWSSMDALYSRQGEVARAQTTLTRLETLLTTLSDAEMGAHGFAMTRRAAYLAPYREAQTTLPAEMARLHALVDDEPVQTQRTRQLNMLVVAKMADLATTIALGEQGQTREVMRRIMVGDDPRILDDIRSVVREMKADENASLSASEAAASAVLGRTMLAVVVTTLLATALLVCVTILFLRALRECERTADERSARLPRERKTREEVAAQAAQLSAIFDAIADWVVVFDASGHITRTNKAALAGMGLAAHPEYAARESADRQIVLNLRTASGAELPPDELPAMRALRGEMVTGPDAVDLRLRGFTGREEQINVSASPFRDAGGNIAGAVMICRDVTLRAGLERRTHDALVALVGAAEALVPSEEQNNETHAEEADHETLRKIGDMTHVVLNCDRVSILTVDRETGGMRQLVLVGGSEEEERQRSAYIETLYLTEYFDPEAASALLANQHVVLHTVVMRPDHASYPHSTDLLLPLCVSGQLFGIMTVERNQVDYVPAEDEVFLASGIAKLAALVLERGHHRRETESVLRGFYDSTQLAIGIGEMAGDDDLLMISCNTAAAAIFKSTPDAVRGRTTRDIGVPERLIKMWRELGAESIATGTSVRGEFPWIGRRILSLRLSAFKTADGRTRVAYVVDDVTAQKETERTLVKARETALEASRLKSQFLANMSHEIRTPLNGVIGMSELLLSTSLNQEQREYASIVHSSASGLLDIINDILDFSKIEAGKLTVEHIPLDLRGIVEEVADVVLPKAHEQSLALMTYVDPDLDRALLGDPARLRQVLLNLAGNAVKFTEHGHISITATRHSSDETSATVRFAVTDTGIGLSQQSRERLFQPFTQADGSTSRRYGGTGLGLSISHRLVELMGGAFEVTSEEGHGSTFAFSLRLEHSEREAPCAGQDVARLRGKRALIVDDCAPHQQILRHYLEAWDVHVELAPTSRDGLTALRAAAAHGTPFDVVIVDLVLPDMDGFALARAIQREPALRPAMLIMLTAFDAADQSRQALQAGFHAYLTKPLKRDQLRTALLRALGETEQAAPQRVEAHELPKPATRATILLAEDNGVNQKLAGAQLRRLGCEVTVVDTGRAALDATARQRFDLVLMDCQMPEMDGYEATRRIRERDAARRRLPIIAMTAHAISGDRERCLDAGMDDYLSKPVTMGALSAVLDRWLPQATAMAPEDDAHDDSAVPARLSVLDTSAWEELRDVQLPGEPDLLAEVTAIFLRTTPGSLQQLQEALAAGDAETVHQLAHRLKSSSATLGGRAFADRCQRIETAAESRELPQVNRLAPRLESDYAQLRDALTRALPLPPAVSEPEQAALG